MGLKVKGMILIDVGQQGRGSWLYCNIDGDMHGFKAISISLALQYYTYCRKSYASEIPRRWTSQGKWYPSDSRLVETIMFQNAPWYNGFEFRGLNGDPLEGERNKWTEKPERVFYSCTLKSKRVFLLMIIFSLLHSSADDIFSNKCITWVPHTAGRVTGTTKHSWQRIGK